MMGINLTELFEVQRKLDAEIERKHPTAPGEDRLAKRILALQVELGECANEWRGFKFWSTDQTPNTVKHQFERVVRKDGTVEPLRNPLLEEYVDCLHFVLSIGLANDFDYIDFAKERKENFEVGVSHKDKNVTKQFLNIYYHLSELEDHALSEGYIDLVLTFISLGEMLGFTWEQITEAYMKKNEINHQRQESGY